MSQVTVYPTWGGQEPRVTAPTPSWMAPPLLDAVGTAPSFRVNLLPEEVAGTCAAPGGAPAESPPQIEPAPPPSPPSPPPYPDLRVEYATLQAQLTAAFDAMTQLRRRILEASEAQLVGLACTIGERIAGRELRSDPEIVVSWAREAIEELANEGSVVVAVSSDIAKALGDAAWAPVRSDSVKIEVDAALGTSSCEVRGPCCSMEASLASRADAVRRAVGGATT